MLTYLNDMVSEGVICFLITDYGVTSYDIGTGFGHFAIATPDVSHFTLQNLRLSLFIVM